MRNIKMFGMDMNGKDEEMCQACHKWIEYLDY